MFSIWPTAEYCKFPETRGKLNILSSNFTISGRLQKKTSTRPAFIEDDPWEFRKTRNLDNEYCSSLKIHEGIMTVGRVLQTKKKSNVCKHGRRKPFIRKYETSSIVRLTTHIGLEKTLLEILL